MKILFFINKFAGGGAERVMATLANSFIQTGHDVYIDYDTSYPSAYDLDKRIISVDHQRLLKNHRCYNSNLLRFPYKLLLIRRSVKNIKPDCIISFVTEVNGPILLATIGLRVPKIVSEHTRIQGFNNTRKNLFIKKYIYRFADAVTVLTRHDYNLWHNYKNVVYMPNPIEINSSEFIPNIKENIVLGVGRINDYHIKGLDTLIKCWSLVCHDYPEWKLWIAGDGSTEKKQELIILNKELNSINVDFIGFQKNLNSIMKRASVFVLPSRVEGLPMGLIEAMNQHCCCIAFDVPTGPAEIIKNGVSGELVENQDISKLTESLRKVLSDKELRCNYSLNAKDSIKRYGIDRITARWIILFNILTQKNG